MVLAVLAAIACCNQRCSLVYAQEDKAEAAAIERLTKSNADVEYRTEFSSDGKATNRSIGVYFGPKWRGGDSGIRDLRFLHTVSLVEFGESIGEAAHLSPEDAAGGRAQPQIVTDAGIRMVYDIGTIEELSLENTSLTDEGLDGIERMVKLKRLCLRATKVTDSGLAKLKRLPSLETLDISWTKITDNGMSHLAAIARLRTLYVGHTAIGDASVRHLGQLKSLRALDVSGTKLSEGSVLQLKKDLTSCGVIWNKPDSGKQKR